MVYRFETFRNNEAVVVLQTLKVSHLSVTPDRFYESPKLKNWMCELCTFSQIRSHMLCCVLCVYVCKAGHGSSVIFLIAPYLASSICAYNNVFLPIDYLHCKLKIPLKASFKDYINKSKTNFIT